MPEIEIEPNYRENKFNDKKAEQIKHKCHCNSQVSSIYQK